MIKKIIIFVIFVLLSYVLITSYFTFEVDPCDIECDNYIDSSLREKCYNDCYEFNSN